MCLIELKIKNVWRKSSQNIKKHNFLPNKTMFKSDLISWNPHYWCPASVSCCTLYSIIEKHHHVCELSTLLQSTASRLCCAEQSRAQEEPLKRKIQSALPQWCLKKRHLIGFASERYVNSSVFHLSFVSACSLKLGRVPPQSSSDSCKWGSGGQRAKKWGDSQLCRVSPGRKQRLPDGRRGTEEVRGAGYAPKVH